MRRKQKKWVALLMLLLAAFLAIPCIQPVQAATPRLNKTKVTLAKGAQIKLKVSGTKAKVKWSTDKRKVATVTSKGVVTAKGKGVARITAKIGKKKLVCRVTVETPKLNKSRLTVNVGKTAALKLTGTKGKVGWYTTDRSIATVTQKGIVRGVRVGSCRVYAKVRGKLFFCVVNVNNAKKPIPSIITTNTPTVTPTEPPTPTDNAEPSASPSPAETASPTTTPTVVPTSVPTDTPEPTAIPTDTPEPTITGSPTPTNTPTPTASPVPTNMPTPIPVEYFQLDKSLLQIYEGESEKITYSIYPENASDKAVVFSSSDEQIAIVGDDGKITGNTPGECTVVANCGGIEKSCAVSVLKKEIIINKNTLIMREGTISRLEYELNFPDAEKQETSFFSSNDDIARIENDGTAIAKSPGECTITIKCGSFCADIYVSVLKNTFINDESNGIAYQVLNIDKEGRYAGGAIVAVINNNPYPIRIKAKCKFYDENGNIVGDSDTGYSSNSCLESGKKSYLHIYGPHMPARSEVCFEIMHSMSGGYSAGINIGKPKIIGDYRKVCAEITNKSSAHSKYTLVSCVFYKDGIPVDISYAYPQVSYVGATEILDFSSSAWPEYDSFEINLEYSHT